jgi:hypothetical protein
MLKSVWRGSNGELKGVWKEAEGPYFEELSQDLLGRGKESHENPP